MTLVVIPPDTNVGTLINHCSSRHSSSNNHPLHDGSEKKKQRDEAILVVDMAIPDISIPPPPTHQQNMKGQGRQPTNSDVPISNNVLLMIVAMK